MVFRDVQTALADNAHKRVAFRLPTNQLIPLHAHVTELSLTTKEYVDCGGTRRSDKAAVLQIWVAHDTDHSLTADTLHKILKNGATLGITEELPVQCEYQKEHFCLFALKGLEINEKAVIFNLSNKQTDCLDKEKCGIPSLTSPGI